MFICTCIRAWPPSRVGSESDCESMGRWFEPRSGHILSLRFMKKKKKKKNYDHAHPSADSRRTKELAHSTGKLPRRLAQEQCGYVN